MRKLLMLIGVMMFIVVWVDYLMWRCANNTCWSNDPIVEYYVGLTRVTYFPDLNLLWLLGISFILITIGMFKGK